MANKSNYRIVKETTQALLIEDLGPWDQYMTVTNNVENVVEELKEKLAGRRLFYMDSEKQMDEILYKRNPIAFKFIGFRS